jgi:hypothetical protein
MQALATSCEELRARTGKPPLSLVLQGMHKQSFIPRANDAHNLHLLTNFATAGYNNTCFSQEDFPILIYSTNTLKIAFACFFANLHVISVTYSQ